MTTGKINIGLIGCGKMGGAMLRGWLSAGIVQHAYVLDPVGIPDGLDAQTVSHFKDAQSLIAANPAIDVFVMAVKPQIMEEVSSSIKALVKPEALVLSIAAGQNIASFESRFGSKQPIIRAMPNTPAAIGKGMTVACPNAPVSESQKDQATQILQAVGLVEWVDDETLLDAVTAVSGSGPAYIFLLIEAMAAAGEKAGLNADFAMKLARQTVIGSAALAETESATPAATLRENVTSPGGTTAAALGVLMNGEFQDIMDKAIAAATARGKELSK